MVYTLLLLLCLQVSATQAAVKDFMRSGIPEDERNLTVLHLAAAEGDSKKILQLIEAGADTEETDRAQWTAIFHAVEKGHTDALRVLLDKGAEPNARTGIDATPLMLAAFYNDEAHKNVSEVLLGHPGIVVDLQEAHGWTALMHAVKFNDNFNQTKLLLDAGAHPNSQDIYGMTPFMTAVERLQIGCIQLMLNRTDLDFSIQDIYGYDVHQFATAADQHNITGLHQALLDKAKTQHDELR